MSAIPTVTGGFYNDIETYVRRIIKSSQAISIDSKTIADYVNRFYIYDMPARLQLFELKRQYIFETIKYINQYQFPYQLYQEGEIPCYCDGIQMGMFTSQSQFNSVYPEQIMNQNIGLGDGTQGPYDFQLSQTPIIRGFIDALGYLAPNVFFTAYEEDGTLMYVVDDGAGNLFQTDASFQEDPLEEGDPISCGTVDYVTGMASFDFFDNVDDGTPIQVQWIPANLGNPRIMLFYNNIMKIYPVPDKQYLIKMDVYVTPSQFTTFTEAVPFAYMSEYLARGAARKILADTGDIQLLQLYEPFFREQENFVLRRTTRQRQALERTPTIYSQVTNSMNPFIYTQR